MATNREIVLVPSGYRRGKTASVTFDRADCSYLHLKTHIYGLNYEVPQPYRGSFSHYSSLFPPKHIEYDCCSGGTPVFIDCAAASVIFHAGRFSKSRVTLQTPLARVIAFRFQRHLAMKSSFFHI